MVNPVNPLEKPEQGTLVEFWPVGNCKVTFPLAVVPLTTPVCEFTFTLFEQLNALVPVTLFKTNVELPEIVNVTGFTMTEAVSVLTPFICPTLDSVPSSSTPPDVHFENVIIRLEFSKNIAPGLTLTVPVTPAVPASEQAWDALTGNEVAVEPVT